MSWVATPKVAFLMPCASGVSPRTLQSAMSIVANACEAGVQIKRVGITERTLVHSARNWMSKEFLAGDCDWAFWMDSDMVLEPRTLTVLLRWAERLNAKFLSGIYYQRMNGHFPVLGVNSAQSVDGKQAMKHKDDYSFSHVAVSENAVKPFQVDMVGFGCVLLHRSVFEPMKYPYFRFIFKEDGDSYISEDTYFCSVARKAGIDIWAVPELQCGHLGQEPVITYKDFAKQQASLAPIRVRGQAAGVSVEGV